MEDGERAAWTKFAAVILITFCCLLGATPAVADEVEGLRQLVRLYQNFELPQHLSDLDGGECHPVQVRRQTIPGSGADDVSQVNLTLWYKTVVAPSDVHITWYESQSFEGQSSSEVAVEGEPVQMPNTIWQTSLIVPASLQSTAKVVLNCPRIRFTLQLNVTEADLSQRELIPFDYNIDPAGEVVYRTGYDGELKVKSERVKAMIVSSHLFNPRNGKMLTTGQVGWETWPVSIVYRSDGDAPRETHFRVNTRLLDASGLIDVTFRSFTSPIKLVHYVEVTEQLVIRPSSQTTPFPNDLVTFDLNDMTPDDDGNLHMDCRNNQQSCDVMCDAYGNSLSSLRLYKSRDNVFGGHRVPVGGRISYGNNYHRSISVNGTPDDLEEEEARFSCVAHSKLGATTTLNMVVHYVVDVEVSSRITVTFLSRTRVKVTCTAMGRPKPTITFALNYQQAYRLVEATSVRKRTSNYKTEAFVVAPLFADGDAATDLLQEGTCSADVRGSRPGHDHRTTSIEDGNRNRTWR